MLIFMEAIRTDLSFLPLCGVALQIVILPSDIDYSSLIKHTLQTSLFQSEGNPPPSVTWYKEETDELLFGGSEKAVTRKRWTEVSPSTEFERTFQFKGESIDNYLSISHVKSKHYRR